MKNELSDDNYDRSLSTVIRDKNGNIIAIVLGVDPGRSNIATMSYILNDEVVKELKTKSGDDKPIKKSNSWQLTRGQYYEVSGIKKLDKEYKKWYSKIDFSVLMEGSLRTTDLEAILKYLEHYSEVKDQWWSLALRRSREAASSTLFRQEESIGFVLLKSEQRGNNDVSQPQHRNRIWFSVPKYKADWKIRDSCAYNWGL